MNEIKTAFIYTDGASRGNPGPSSIGIVILDKEEQMIASKKAKISSHQTNNFAEYTAVLEAIKMCETLPYDQFVFRSDSKLLVEQLLGNYKVKSENIRPLYQECKKKIEGLKKGKDNPQSTVLLQHIPREKNTEADRLANLALDA